MTLLIRDAVFPRDAETVRTLLREYETDLGVSLCFQAFEEELRVLPGRYAPPTGVLLLAANESGVVGCVALRALAGGECEMKRLFVRPQGRGSGAGRALVRAAIERAREIGHRRMVLDTLERMGPAIALYRALGFRDIEAYCDNPLPDAVYLGLEL